MPSSRIYTEIKGSLYTVFIRKINRNKGEDKPDMCLKCIATGLMYDA